MSAVVRAVKKVVKKVVNTVVDTVKAAIKDPITTIAKVAAYATGNAWAIPLIDGASTLAKGGSIGDALKATAISYGTQAIAVKVGTPVGNAAGNLAASQGATVATQKLVTNIVTRAAGNAAVAVITKQDPVKAFVAGGVSAASSAVLGQIPGFDKQPAWVQNTVASSVGAYVAGQQTFDEAAAASIIATSGIVQSALKTFDPEGTRLTASQRSIAADAIFKTTSAALAGRSPTEALQQSLTNAAAAALGEFAKDTVKWAAEGMAEGYARLNGYGEQLDSIAVKSTAATTRFNDVNGSLQAAINEQNRLFKAQQDARAAYDRNVTDANYNAAQAAVKAYNDYTTALNKSYNEYYKPTLDALSTEVQGYQAEYDSITGRTSAEQEKLKTQIDNLTKTLDPVYANSNRAFAEGLMPGFDAAAYRALNPNLPAGTDPYLHYITTGQYEGRKGTQDQLKEATDIVNAILTNPNVDERALQAYIDSGYLTQDFVASVTKKNYNDLVNELGKRVTTEDEARAFFKDVYGREATSETDLATVQKFTGLAEAASRANLYAAKTLEDDMAMFVYDGANAKSQSDAHAQAQKKGYNTYSYDGDTYTILPQEERDQRVELGKQILAAQGKNLADASDQDIARAMELANRVPQDRLKTGVTAQDVINGNYSGWRDGKYYEYAGGNLQGVYAIDPATGKYTLERVEVRGGAGETTSEIVVTAPRDLSDLATDDPAGYLELAKKMDDSAKDELGDFFTKSLNAAMLAAETGGNKELADNIRQTFSIATQGLGEQTENLAKFFASVTGGSYDTSLIRAAKALQAWGAANQSASTVAQEDAIIDAVEKAKGIGNKITAFIGAAKDNPGGFFTLVAKEGVQEILPLWAAKGVYTLGKVAAYGANAALEGMESWGSSSSDVYSAAIRSGKNEAEARDMALKAGFQSAVITATTVGVTDIPMVKRVLGEGAVSSFKDIGKATAASTMGEYVEELFQNANNQRIVNGTINWEYATTAATVAAGVSAGTTGSIMTGLNIRDTAFVAKDVNGNDVTLSDFLAGTKQIDMKTVNMNTVVGTSADGDNVTLGGAAAMQMSSGVSYDTFKTALPAVVANQDFVIGTDALGDQVTLSQAMGQVTSTKGFDSVYNSLLNTTAEQRVQAQTDFLKTTLTNAGYKPSDAEIRSLVQSTPPGTAALNNAAQQYADTHTVTEAEATKALKDAYTAAGFKDYEPTKEQITSFMRSGADVDQAAVVENIKTYVNENSVTYDEAKKMLSDRGYTPTDAEIKQFVATTNQQAQLNAVAQYVDPRQVTFDEAKAMMERMGYKPTEAEIREFMGQKNDAAYQAQQEAALGAYVDPRMVDEGEVREAYTKLGLKKPTIEDVRVLMGQYDEANLTDKAQKNLDAARYNSIMFELENMATQAGVSPEALDAMKADFNAQFEALGLDVKTLSEQVGGVRTDIAALRDNLTSRIEAAARTGADADAALKSGLDSLATDLGVTKDALLARLGTTEDTIRSEVAGRFEEVSARIADTEARLTQAIEDAKAAGLEGAEALKAAIDAVATDLGTTKIDLLSQLGATEASLRADLAAQLGEVQTQITDTRTALEAAIADAKASGLAGDAALQQAINTVAADLGLTKTDLLSQLGTTEANLRTEFATQIGEVQTQLGATRSALEAAIADAKASGLAGDAALQQAINTVAADLGLTKTDLLSQLGTTEANLRTEFATQIGEVQTQLGATRSALEAAIADAKASGLAGDAALQQAINTVAADLGLTKTDLLSQLGTTEANLRTEFATQIGEVQTQLGATRSALEAAIADAKASGLAGDAALQQAINTVAADLGLTKTDLLAQLGTTEANLRTEFATQIGEVQTQLAETQKAILDRVAQYEAAGVARADALSLAITDVSTQLGTTKADLLARLGTTEANLQQQISGVSADVQAKYDSLTAQQKALADQLIQQGVDLNTAITQATAAVSADVQAKFNALTTEQQALARQLQQQGVDLNAAIAQAQQQTQGQITNLTQDVQTKYDTLSQGQKDLATQLAQQGFDLRTAIEIVRTQTGAGFDDLRSTLTQNQQETQAAIAAEAERTRQAQAAEAERTRQAQAAASLKTQRLGNLNTMMNMLGQAPDLTGQQVTVKAPDPAKIGYIYDWSSIFANPSQEKMFASPYGAYAKGGTVRSELDDVNDELLKILRG